MSTGLVEGIQLAAVSVRPTASFGDALAALAAAECAAIAVVDDEGRVKGLFGPGEALRGLLPGYVDDLHHTAFAREDLGLLAERAARVRSEPVERFAAKPVTLERQTSALHAGELFVHSGSPALAVVEADRFVGMLDRRAFISALLRLGDERVASDDERR